ncbi:MAG TPA: hypothetical protein PLC53_02970 [Bacilli bacterium]|nr:hypothetical protein [Bacilli bacterium]
MKKEMDIDDIIWINVNMDWMRSVIYEYNKAGKSLGMEYLSMGSLRYDDKYFVGYIFDVTDPVSPIDLVTYIQYETHMNKLVVSYIEVAEQYRGNGIANKTINEFFASLKDYADNSAVEVVVTNISPDGKKANLMQKLQQHVQGEIVETGKRNII